MTDKLRSLLAAYHPIVIEGMGKYDPRDPALVASWLTSTLLSHWGRKPEQKPKLIVTQGDPLEERGISAITPRVAAKLGIARGLVCLDQKIAEYHSPNADRNNVILEVRYTELAAALEESQPGIMKCLEDAIDRDIIRKNQKRKVLGKAPLKNYFRDFALLQEVTKAAWSQLCGGVTVIQTSSEINEFSVTSFYTVGLELGLISSDEMAKVAF